MNVKSLIGAVIESIIKFVVLGVAVMYILRGATAAYEFGYKVFADKPMSAAGGRTITVGIGESASVKDIGEMLQEKGLIEDARLFVIQERLSAYHGEIRPGIYDLSTAMTAEEMLAVISAPAENEPETNAEPVSLQEEEYPAEEILQPEEEGMIGEDALEE